MSRINYQKESAALFQKLFELSNTFKDSPIETTARHLLHIRASQINGCAFCVDMHIKQAKLHGERELRLHHIAIWRESNLFTPKERAILEWTELLTKIPAHGVSDEDYARAREQLSERELSDLTYDIGVINTWNRLNVAFRNEPGSLDKAWGLDKAGLN